MTTTIDRLRSRIAARMKLTHEELDRRLSLFAPTDDADGDLITAVGRESANGLNDALRTFNPAAVSAQFDSLEDDFLAPFYVEGASMAFAAARALHPSKVRSTQGILLSVLSINGKAFATCFLKAKPPRFDVARPFPNPECEAQWLQGCGRALWFVASGHSEVFRGQHEQLDPQQRPELCAGPGLATAFAGMRRLHSPPEAPSGSATEGCAFFQGLAFGLTARREASPRNFRGFIDQLYPSSWQLPVRVARSPDGGCVAWQRQIRSELPRLERSQ